MPGFVTLFMDLFVPLDYISVISLSLSEPSGFYFHGNIFIKVYIYNRIPNAYQYKKEPIEML